MSYQPAQELAELLSAQTEGDLDAASARRLAELLRSDAEAMRFYVEYCQVHAILAWEHGVLGTPPPEAAPCPMPPLPTWHEWLSTHWTWMLVVGLLLASCVAAWQWPRGSAAVAWERRETVGTVTRSVGARLDVLDVKRPFAADGALRTGHYRLAEGVVEMTLGSGVTVLAEAPAQFRILSAASVVVEQGRLAARVLESGTEFKVQTPDVHLTDFGTEFAVDVSADEGTEVHVFEGFVDVRPTFGHGVEPVRLAANQATRVDRASSVPAGIDCAPARFLRHLDEPNGPYAQAVLALQPVVYFRMTPSDDGRTLVDSAPGGHHARIERIGGMAPPFAAGRVGHALRLGGPTTQQYAVVPDYPKAQDHALTVMAWVWAESRPRWASIAKNWAKALGVNHGGQFHLGLYHDEGSLEGHVHDAEGNEVWVREEGVPLALDRWHHVALVTDGTTLRLYRNGTEVAAMPCEGLSTFAPPGLGIGAKLDATGRAINHKTTGFWHGRIDELAIFNHAISAEQILELYHFANKASLKPPTFRLSDRFGIRLATDLCHSPIRRPHLGTVAERMSNAAPVLLVANEHDAGAGTAALPGPPQPLPTIQPGLSSPPCLGHQFTVSCAGRNFGMQPPIDKLSVEEGTGKPLATKPSQNSGFSVLSPSPLRWRRPKPWVPYHGQHIAHPSSGVSRSPCISLTSWPRAVDLPGVADAKLAAGPATSLAAFG